MAKTYTKPNPININCANGFIPVINKITVTSNNSKTINVSTILDPGNIQQRKFTKVNLSRAQRFFNWALAQGYLVPGITIPLIAVEQYLGISATGCLAKNQWVNYQMALLGPIGYVRDQLLWYGIYFGQEDGDFVVNNFNVSHKAVKGYANKGCNATQRAIILNNNIPDNCNPYKNARHALLKVAYDALKKIQ